jgi:hypothetical protein
MTMILLVAIVSWLAACDISRMYKVIVQSMVKKKHNAQNRALRVLTGLALYIHTPRRHPTRLNGS